MLTLSMALERLRRDLGDTDPVNALWSSEDLERHLRHALREFSEHIPREMKTTLSTTAGSREISLATLTDRVRLVAVEWKTGKYPPEYQRFAVWQDTLTLLVDPAPTAVENVNVYWHALQDITPEGSTIPAWAEDLLVLGAVGYAAQEATTRATNQVNTGGSDVAKQYAAQARTALAQFSTELGKRGVHGSVRSSRFYVPAAPLPTQDTDPGPP